MAITNAFAAIAVADYEAALAWYERLLGRAPDMIPKQLEAAWQLTQGGWIYLVADAARAGTALLTLLVDDLEAHVGELAERGLATGTVETVPGVVRTAVIADPDGNTMTFGEPLGADR
jgi:glyoxylase I family protein